MKQVRLAQIIEVQLGQKVQHSQRLNNHTHKRGAGLLWDLGIVEKRMELM